MSAILTTFTKFRFSLKTNHRKYLLKYSILLFVFLTVCQKDHKNMNENTSLLCFNTTFINTNLSDDFLAIFFINRKNGFISGRNGGIYKTTDSAKTWTKLNSTTTLPIRDIYFLDNSNGFAVGGENSCGGTGCTPPGGFILKTQDGGQSWTKIFTPSDRIEISSIYFIDKIKGFCIGDNVIFKTNDGGQTWMENKINNLGGKMMKISFVDHQNGFIVCLFDKILKTNNGGLTWEISSPNKDVCYSSISSSEGVSYVSGQGRILKSANGGSSWTELVNSPSDIYAIKFTDKNIGYAFGRGNYSGGCFGHSYGSMYCTNNGGATWNGNGDFKEVGPIESVSFPVPNIGYAISGNKIIKILIKKF
jgi:photosystem II stability/assembly factor-like uncharacterized protein